MPKLRNSKLTTNFLDAVNIRAVAIMIAVVIKISDQILLDWKAIFIALESAILVFGVKNLDQAGLS